MRPSEALILYRQDIRDIVLKNHASNARVFGSVLRGMDTEQSDLDILVDTTPETTLLDIARIQRQLSQVLCVEVDVMTPKSLSAPIRERVIKEAKSI